MSAVWRLIRDPGPAKTGRFDGAWNMALDRAIQLACAAGESPPTLRLYGWVRPTVTLGRFQKTAGVDRELCLRRGIDVVRRFTGGRGVLHDDEVTYSVCAGVSDGIPRGTAASYRTLCSALVEAYALLGVSASLTRQERRDSASSACYMLASLADVSLGSSKLSGSAQVWASDTVLQHGSFVRSRDLDREANVFGLSSAERDKLSATTSTLSDALGYAPDAEAIGDAVCEAFERVLGVSLDMGEPSPSEEAAARRLLAQTKLDQES